MAIAFRTGSTSTQNTTTHLTSETIVLSSSIVSGDLVVVAVAWASTGAASALALSGGGVTWASAYAVPLGGGSGFGTGVNVRVFYAIAGSSTPSATLTGTSSNSGPVMMIACSYSGASGLDVANGSSNTASGGVTTLAEPAVTTTVANDWLIAVLGAWTLSTATLTVTNPTDAATSRSTTGAGNFQYLGLSDSNGTVTAGSHGSGSWSWTGASAPAGALLAITATAATVTSTGSAGLAALAPSGTVAVPFTATGSAGLAALKPSGTVAVPFTSTGSAGLAALGVSGASAETYATSGSAGLPAHGLSGSGTVANPVTSSGSLGLAALGVSGTGTETYATSGSAGVSAPGISGTATVASPVTSTGSAGLNAPGLSGTGTETYTSTGSAAAATLLAAGSVTVANPVTTSGSVAPAPLAATGSATETYQTSGGIAPATLGVSGTATVAPPVPSSGSAGLGALATSGLAGVGNVIGGMGSAGLAPPGMAGTGQVPFTSAGGAGLAAPGMSGTGTETITSTGSAGLAALAAAGSETETYAASGGMGLASPGITGSASVPFTSTGSIALAALAASGSGTGTIPPVTTSGSLALPAAGTSGSASVPVPVTSSGSAALGGTGVHGTASAATAASPSWDPSGSYTPEFSDDFTTLNTNVWALGWGAASGISGPINAATSPGVDGEAAAYNSTAVSVSGGNLQLALTATPITAGGVTYPYTGACVTTNPATLGTGKGFQFTGGAVEARIYLPESTSGDRIANWPALWLDGQTWPADGEIDIMEGLGGTAQWHCWSAANYPGVGAAAPGQGDGTDTAYFSPYAGGWHTYGVSWDPVSGQIDYYYDGIRVGSLRAGTTFSTPMYIILNNTTGWQSGPETAPATMLVDWVRVWSPASALATIPPIANLADGFASPATLQTLWCASSEVTVSGGQAGIQCDTSYGGLLSSGTVYDLTGGQFYARITNPAGTVETGMSLTDQTRAGTGSNQNSIDWYYNGSSLVASITQAGTKTTVATLTYSATTHAYWKIAESGGTITWATSSNGTSWTAQGTHTRTMAVKGLWALIYTGNDGTGTLTTSVDNVNGGVSSGITAAGSIALAPLHPSGSGAVGPHVTTAGSVTLPVLSPHGSAGQTGGPVSTSGSMALGPLSILRPPPPAPEPSTPGLAQPGYTTPGDAGLGAPVIYTAGAVTLAPFAAAGGPESQRLLMAFAF